MRGYQDSPPILRAADLMLDAPPKWDFSQDDHLLRLQDPGQIRFEIADMKEEILREAGWPGGLDPEDWTLEGTVEDEQVILHFARKEEEQVAKGLHVRAEVTVVEMLSALDEVQRRAYREAFLARGPLPEDNTHETKEERDGAAETE